MACAGSPFTFPDNPATPFGSPLPLIRCPPDHENDAVVMGMLVPVLYRGARCGLPRRHQNPTVDGVVIAKRNAAPHDIRIKRAPSREPVLLAALLLSALPSDNVPTAVVYSEPLRIVCQSGWQEEETE